MSSLSSSRSSLTRRVFTLLVLSLTVITVAHAQYSTSVFDLKQAQDLYDERGYGQAGSIDVDGHISVATANGSVSYTYPISESYVGGASLRVVLNYAGSVQFTTLGTYNLAHASSGGASEYNGWQRFEIERPAWIIGVNGFAIDVLATTLGNFRPKAGSSVFAGESEYNDHDFTWLIDGYDFCNRMRDFSAAGSGTGDIADVVKLLREDGSVLELYNVNPRPDGGHAVADTASWLYTGSYHTLNANDRGFATVQFDSSFTTDTTCGWQQSVALPLQSLITTERDRRPLYPRILKYYPGDGLEYVFRERIAPYGNDSYFRRTAAGENTGGLYGHPSIFYLEAIMSGGDTVTGFYRTRHYPTYQIGRTGPLVQYLDPLKELDSTRGRALITEFRGHRFSFNDAAMTIEAMGRTTKVYYLTQKASGPSAGGYMPLASLGYMTPLAQSLASTSDTNPSFYASYVGYVTKIVDPENRTTDFTYEQYRREYTDFDFPQSSPSPTITLSNYRLKSVTEPTARYLLHYRGDTALATINHSTLSTTDHGVLNNVVDTLFKQTRSGTPLVKTFYSYGQDGLPNKPLWTLIRQRDEVTGHTHETETWYGLYNQPTPSSLIIPQPRHTEVVNIIQRSDTLVTQQEMHYATGDMLPGVMGGSPFIVVPTETTVRRNGIRTSYEQYTYDLDTVNSFGGVDSLAGKYGMDIRWKATASLRPDNTMLRTVDTVVYQYLPKHDTTIILVTNTEWDKLLSVRNYFLYRDSLHDPRVVGKLWEEVKDFPPVAGYVSRTDTVRFSAAPVAGLEVRRTRVDASGTVRAGVRHRYETLSWEQIARGVPRARLVQDTIVGDSGKVLVGPERFYNYRWYDQPTQVTAPTGAKTSYAYGVHRYFWDTTRAWITAVSDSAMAWQRSNHYGASPSVISPSSLNYRAPVGERSYVRRSDSFGVVTNDSLTTSREFTFYGRAAKETDANGWMSKYAYDNNGRLRTAWLPYDFPPNPHAEGYDTVAYNARFSLDMYGWTEYWHHLDTLYCHLDCSRDTIWDTRNIYTPAAVEQGILRAEYPVTTFPKCPCEGATAGKEKDEEDRSLATTWDAKTPFRGWSQYGGVRGYLSIPKDTNTAFGSLGSLDSAWLAVLVTDVKGACVTLEVSVPRFSFSRTYIFNCGGGGGDLPYRAERGKGNARGLAGNGVSIAEGGRLLQFDMTPIKDSLVAMANGQTLVVQFKVNTPGAAVEMVSGTESEDMRPRLWLKGSVYGWVEGRDDYTLAYDHNDTALQTTVSAKTDDTIHAASRGGLDFVRRSQMVHNFGADYRLLQSEALIGNPASPMRRDTVRKAYTGGGGALRTIDVEGDTSRLALNAADQVDTVWSQDGSYTVTGYRIGAPIPMGITDQDFYGFCSMKTTENRLLVKTVEYRDAFDSVRRVVVDSGGKRMTTKYHYDLMGRLDSVINPQGQVTTYTYDAFGRVRTKTHPDLGTISYAYDMMGNVRFTQTEDQANRGRLTFNEYDDLNRLVLVGEAFFSNEGKWDTLYPPQSGGGIEDPGGGGGIGSKTERKEDGGAEKRGDGRHLASGGARLTDQINPNLLHNGGIGPLLTANATVWKTQQYVVPLIIPASPSTWWKSTCLLPPLTEFGEMTIPDQPAIAHRWTRWTVPTPPADTNEFENVAKYPHFPRMAVAYDTLPARMGPVWLGFPSWAKWDSLAPTGRVRYGRGREVATAWRERHDQPYHYAVVSYDERGRVEALLRYTETIGFDAVYYRYNSLNQTVQVMTADPYHRHTAWYGSDWNGRIDSVWSVLERDSGLVPGGSSAPVFSQARFCGWAQRPDSAEIVYSYTRTGAVDTMRYARIGVEVNYDYNRRKFLDSLVVKRAGMDLFREVLDYDTVGQIIDQQWQHGGGPRQQHHYWYDPSGWLAQWGDWSTLFTSQVHYNYDSVGNRTLVTRGAVGQIPGDEYYYASGTNHLTLIKGDMVGGTPQWTMDYTYDGNGSMTGRRRLDNIGFWRDSLRWSYRGLLDRYQVDAYTEPRQEWQYRYNPMGERESKREVRRGLVLDNQTDSLLPWQYYLLGGAKEQRAVWNGRLHSKSMCSDTGRRVYFYPSEYLTFGGRSRSITTRPNGDREYAIVDHLGSTRVVLDSWGNPISTKDYEPFGAEVMPGAGPRKSWVDRQQDGESGLRNHGVRQYDEETGRFVSTDPDFEFYATINTYQYGANSPIINNDPSGDTVRFMYDGDKRIEEQTMEALRLILNSDTKVKDALLAAHASKDLIIVTVTKNGGSNTRQEVDGDRQIINIRIATLSSYPVGEEAPLFVVLGHELGHMDRWRNGTHLPSEDRLENGLKTEESQTVKEYENPLRKFYSKVLRDKSYPTVRKTYNGLDINSKRRAK